MTFSQKLLKTFSLILLLTYSVFYACFEDYYEGEYYSNFTPESFADISYSPLFLSGNLFYNPEPLQINKSRFNDEVIKDWGNYLGNSMKNKLVHFFLIESSSTDIIKLYSFINTNKPNLYSEKWSKIINLDDEKIKNFVEFLYLAHQVEKVSVSEYNSWDYVENSKAQITNKNLLSLLENKYETSTDSFIKNRYWFQTIKAYFYSNSKNYALNFFKLSEANVQKNTLYYRALAYIAGINYQQKKYALSNYQFSIVFEKCKPLQILAAYNFHPQNQSDWEESLNMATTEDEKASLWAVHGYYNDEIKSMEEIYQLKPESPHLEYLLTRLINIQETKVSNLNYETAIENKQIVKDSLNIEALEIVEKIAVEGKTSKPYLWNIAAGYLQTMNGDYAKAVEYFDKTELQLPKNQLAENQLRLLRFINNLSNIEDLNSVNEATIVEDLNWLYFDLPAAESELPSENPVFFRYYNASVWSKNYLSALYRQQNNFNMSELFYKTKDYSNSYDIEQMKMFMRKSNKSKIEEIALKIYEFDLDDLLKHQSIIAAYNNDIPLAIKYMTETDSAKFEIFKANPFKGSIKDCIDCDNVAVQKKKYSALDFLRILKSMQDAIDNGSDVYNNSILLGNAFYNLTFFGNLRSFNNSNILGYGSTPRSYSPKNRRLITDCKLAKSYYNLAYNKAGNDEQRARCQYLISKCERNEYYNIKYSGENDWWGDNKNQIDFIAWNGFKNLKYKYSKTNFFREVIKECGYFKTYTQRR